MGRLDDVTEGRSSCHGGFGVSVLFLTPADEREAKLGWTLETDRRPGLTLPSTSSSHCVKCSR